MQASLSALIVMQIGFALISPVSYADNSAFRDSVCSNLMQKIASENRNKNDTRINLNDDLSYLREVKRASSEGVMRSFFDHDFDTRIFHTNTSLPDVQTGQVPVVDPRAKALYVFIHGSGTMKSSGRNFAAQMNQLAELGYAAISFDLPYHADGPMNPKHYTAEKFMKWIKSIIDKYRVQGMPIYMAGHSFGPDVVAEFIRQHPKDISGGVMLSPASFNPTLDKWYETYTSKMVFGGDVPSNTTAGEWSHAVSQQFLWRSGNPAHDPTLLNPDIRLRVLSGNMEEYVPGPVGGKNRTPIGVNTYDIKSAILQLLRGAEVTVESGIGHYIFDFKDANGVNVVLRELLLVAGENPKEIQEIRKEHGRRQLTVVQSILEKYVADRLFQAWVDSKMGPRRFMQLMDKENERVAKNLLEEYDVSKKQREKIILDRLLATKDWAPDFYRQYEGRIRQAKDYGAIFLIYIDLLEKLSEETIRQLHPLNS